jgi:hypothetical protein
MGPGGEYTDLSKPGEDNSPGPPTQTPSHMCLISRASVAMAMPTDAWVPKRPWRPSLPDVTLSPAQALTAVTHDYRPTLCNGILTPSSALPNLPGMQETKKRVNTGQEPHGGHHSTTQFSQVIKHSVRQGSPEA